jgi:hypothetical protein
MSRPAALLALLFLPGCVTHQVATDPLAGIAISVDAMLGDSIANVLITRALAADAAFENPDSVYSDDAEVVANGELRTEAPRLAGSSPGGHLLLGSSRTMVTASLIWGSIEYRWIPESPDAIATSGYATIIVGRARDGSWRVVHLHSSTIPPPDAQQPARPDTTGRAGH